MIKKLTALQGPLSAFLLNTELVKSTVSTLLELGTTKYEYRSRNPETRFFALVELFSELMGKPFVFSKGDPDEMSGAWKLVKYKGCHFGFKGGDYDDGDLRPYVTVPINYADTYADLLVDAEKRWKAKHPNVIRVLAPSSMYSINWEPPIDIPTIKQQNLFFNNGLTAKVLEDLDAFFSN